MICLHVGAENRADSYANTKSGRRYRRHLEVAMKSRPSRGPAYFRLEITRNDGNRDFSSLMYPGNHDYERVWACGARAENAKAEISGAASPAGVSDLGGTCYCSSVRSACGQAALIGQVSASGQR